MKKLLGVFLKYLLFWLIYFWLSKLIFILFNYELTSNLSFSEIQKIFTIGTRMDLSMACYFVILPGFMLAFSFAIPSRLFHSILKIYTKILLVVAIFLNILDLDLYPHWGTRISIAAFNYLGDPKGIASNIIWTDILLIIALSSFYFILFNWIFNRFFTPFKKINLKNAKFSSPVLLFLTACLIIPIRGGLGSSPMNLSTISFSNKLYPNQAASNYFWHFINSIERRDSYANPCNYTTIDEAKEIFNSIENQRVNPDSIFIETNGTIPPNVLLIVLESFSNKVISSFGGEYGVCPNIDSISAEGIIFPSFYSSGNRSDRGISALLGGYPSLLDLSIMRFPDKSSKLTLISNYFNQHNYQSSFYYGGDINFYNLKSFVLQGDYNEIVSQRTFTHELQNMSSWGVPDGYLFDRVLADLPKKKKPFFTVAYTLSSHRPYDVPTQMIKGQSTEAKFLNSVAYTDSCLGEFIRAFKKTNCWENTLVIITADHGALEPGATEIIEPETYRIPLIWTGGTIKKPRIISHIGGQVDLIPSLIHQLGWEKDSLIFGHDLFSSPSYAFYMLESGWGYISPEGEYYFDQITKQFQTFNQTGQRQPNFDFAKAYLQVLHDDFLSK